MDFLTRYCGPGSIPARWQAGIFSMMIQGARKTVPPLDGRPSGSRNSEGVRERFDDVVRHEVVLAVRQDAAVGFGAMRRMDYDGMPRELREAMGIGPGRKAVLVDLLMTERAYHTPDCMRAILTQAVTSAGRLPLVCESWTGRDTLHGVLSDMGFTKVLELPCGYAPRPDVNRIFWAI